MKAATVVAASENVLGHGFDVEKFAQYFAVLTDVNGGGRILRELVLHLAVQGRLVEHLSETPVSAEQIASSRERAVHELHLRSHPETTLPEGAAFRFVLPKSWCAVSLGDLAFSCPTSYGEDPSPPLLIAGVVKVGNIDNQGGFKGAFSDRGFRAEEIESLLARRGDLMVVKSSGSAENVHSGKAALCTIEHDGKIVGTNFVLRLRLFMVHALPEYVWRVLTSPYSRAWIEQTVQTMTYPNLKWSDLATLPIPLPPLAEQKRIVAKVDQLMALCDDLETRQTKKRDTGTRLTKSALEALTSAEGPKEFEAAWDRVVEHFPLLIGQEEDVDDIRKAIVEMAIRGHLVAQSSTDESAVVLLSRIELERARAKTAGKKVPQPTSIDDVVGPFPIPDTWQWVRWGRLALGSDSGWSPQCETRARGGGEWGVLKVSAVSWGTFLPEENKVLPQAVEPRLESAVRRGDFLMSRANTAELVGRSVIVAVDPERVIMSDKIVRCEFSTLIDKRYVNLFNKSASARAHYVANASGTSDSMKNISRDVIFSMPLPLPPLREQERIVAKVEHLMRICDELDSGFKRTGDLATKVIEAVVQEISAGQILT